MRSPEIIDLVSPEVVRRPPNQHNQMALAMGRPSLVRESPFNQHREMARFAGVDPDTVFQNNTPDVRITRGPSPSIRRKSPKPKFNQKDFAMNTEFLEYEPGCWNIYVPDVGPIPADYSNWNGTCGPYPESLLKMEPAQIQRNVRDLRRQEEKTREMNRNRQGRQRVKQVPRRRYQGRARPQARPQARRPQVIPARLQQMMNRMKGGNAKNMDRGRDMIRTQRRSIEVNKKQALLIKELRRKLKEKKSDLKKKNKAKAKTGETSSQRKKRKEKREKSKLKIRKMKEKLEEMEKKSRNREKRIKELNKKLEEFLKKVGSGKEDRKTYKKTSSMKKSKKKIVKKTKETKKAKKTKKTTKKKKSVSK